MAGRWSVTELKLVVVRNVYLCCLTRGRRDEDGKQSEIR